MDTLDRYDPSPRTEAPRAYLAALLLQTTLGDHGAFTEFYQSTSRLVFSLIRRVVIDPGLSEEVMQEVFIVVWKDAAKYDPAAGSPLGWLVTIAHRRAVDKVRQYQSGANRDARWAAATHSVPYDEVAEAVTDRIDTRLLMESLAGLSAPQRESVTMAYFGSLTYKEVAQTLSIPLPTVKSRVREGLKRLRVQLEPA